MHIYISVYFMFFLFIFLFSKTHIHKKIGRSMIFSTHLRLINRSLHFNVYLLEIQVDRYTIQMIIHTCFFWQVSVLRIHIGRTVVSRTVTRKRNSSKCPVTQCVTWTGVRRICVGWSSAIGTPSNGAAVNGVREYCGRTCRGPRRRGRPGPGRRPFNGPPISKRWDAALAQICLYFNRSTCIRTYCKL